MLGKRIFSIKKCNYKLQFVILLMFIDKIPLLNSTGIRKDALKFVFELYQFQ